MKETTRGRSFRFWAGGFLFNPKNRSVFLHKRDGNTIYYPNQWAFFGGTWEKGESAEACYIREMEEEIIGLKLFPENVHFLTDRTSEEVCAHWVVFYSISEAARKEFVLGEGADFGWIPLDDLCRFDLAEPVRADLQWFIARLDEPE